MNYTRLAGNILIVLSLIGLSTVFYPVVKDYFAYYLNVETTETIVDTSFSIHIPKIRARAQIHQDVDPWDASDYQPLLQTGVAHALGSSIPGEEGPVYVFAHSSDVPWRLTRYNTAFYRLFLLDVGDEIEISHEGENYIYRVREKKVVYPDEVSYLTENDRTELILQTCAPVGTDLKRLLVFADLI